MRTARTAALVLAGLLALLAAPAPASARNIGSDDEIVISGTVRVPRGEHADRIVIGDGRVDVAGHVDGVLLSLDAPVRIRRTATIDGDVIAVSRRVTIDSGATLNGDLIYGRKKPSVAPGVTIYGDFRRFNPGDISLPFSAFLIHAAIWIAFTFSSLALGLLLLWLAPGVADSASAARARAGPAIALGVALFIGLPLAAVVAVLTLVGIPFGLGLLLALLPLYALGYVASAYVLGRRVLNDACGRFAAFLAGWGILRVLALVPVLGTLVWLAATIFGLGLLTVALWQARRHGEQPPERPAAPAAPLTTAA